MATSGVGIGGVPIAPCAQSLIPQQIQADWLVQSPSQKYSASVGEIMKLFRLS